MDKLLECKNKEDDFCPQNSKSHKFEQYKWSISLKSFANDQFIWFVNVLKKSERKYFWWNK